MLWRWAFKGVRLLAAVNAFRTSLHWHDANVVNTNMFLAQSPSNLTCYSHASTDSMHISIFTMYSTLGPPLIEGVMQLEHMWSPLGPQLALPSSMFILVTYPVCRITRMCTKICRLGKWFMVVLQLPRSYKASITVTHFPAAIDQWLRVAAWTLM